MNFFGAPVTATVPDTVPMPHCPEEPALAELPELLPQHMLELPLDPELLLPTHDSELTIRLAKEVRPKPDAICGSTVTNKTKLAAAITAIRARGCQLFMLTTSCHTPLPVCVGEAGKPIPRWANEHAADARPEVPSGRYAR